MDAHAIGNCVADFLLVLCAGAARNYGSPVCAFVRHTIVGCVYCSPGNFVWPYRLDVLPLCIEGAATRCRNDVFVVPCTAGTNHDSDVGMEEGLSVFAVK